MRYNRIYRSKPITESARLLSAIQFFIILLLIIPFELKSATDIGGWTARVLQVAGAQDVRYVEDYATERYGHAWDFDEDERYHPDAIFGAVSSDISAGYLSFIASGTSQLVWGDRNGTRPAYGQEKIADQWKIRFLPWVIRIKLSQSLPSSQWYVEADYLKNGRYKKVRKTAELNGDQEQILTIPMGVATSSYHALAIGTQTPDNKVKIDWVRVERPSAMRYFQYVFDLDEQPLSGGLSLGINAAFSLYLNGELLVSHSGQGAFVRKINTVSGLKNFRKGKNIIAITADAFGSRSSASNSGDFFFLQGGVTLESGAYYQLQTDQSWRGTYWATPDWLDMGKVDAHFESVKDLGTLLRNGLDGYSYNGRGQFREVPYFGAIEVVPRNPHGNPFFHANESPEFAIELQPGLPNHIDKVSCSVFAPDRSTITPRQILQLQTNAAAVQQGVLSLPVMQPGVYILEVEYERPDGSIDSHRLEFVVIGAIPQRSVGGTRYTDGMALRLTDKIDFSGGLEARRVLEGHGAESRYPPGSRIDGLLSTVGGDAHYLQTGNKNQDWVSFQFAVGSPYHPHLIEVDYPDDEARNMVFLVAEGSRFQRLQNIGPGGGIARLSPGVYTGDDLPNSKTTLTERAIFWPNHVRATFTLINTGASGRERGAISQVRVYELLDDLPAFAGRLPGGRPFVGPLVERIDRSTPQVFYAGPLEGKFIRDLKDGQFEGSYQAWYQTISNLIKYLRFTGQNTYFAGIYMYYGGWFPSDRFQGWANTGGNYLGVGWDAKIVELMAEMFDANDLNLVLGVQFIGSKRLVEADNVTDDQVARGVKSLRFIDSSGRQVFGFQNEGYNFLHPEVRAELLALAHQISDRYSDYPAIKGVTWTRLPSFPSGLNSAVSWNPLDVGYGDVTISSFQHETGINIPVTSSGEDRFERRRDWLLSEMQDVWRDWRSNKVAEMDGLLAKALGRKRQDWYFWHILTRPNRKLLELWVQNKATVSEMYQSAGLDPRLYDADSKMRLVPSYELTGYRQYSRGRSYSRIAREIPRFNEALISDSVFGQSSVFAHIGFMAESQLKTSDEWLWENVFYVGYSRPAAESFLAEFARAAGDDDRELLIIGWGDAGQFTGGEQEIRRLILSLPH